MDIAWAFNGVPISAESTDQFSITKGKRLSVLSIDAVAARHAGEYTCTASNKAGAASHTAALAVNGNTCIHAPPSQLFFSRREKTKLLFIIPFIILLPHRSLTPAHNLFNIPSRFVKYGGTMRTCLSVVWLRIVRSWRFCGSPCNRVEASSSNDAVRMFSR